MAQARGYLETIKLQSDADYFQSQKQAEALVAEKKAHAKGIQKENEALAGAGGRTMVKLRIAESLLNKEIVFLPSGKSGVGIQSLNLNQLLSTYAVEQVAENTSSASTAPASGAKSTK